MFNANNHYLLNQYINELIKNQNNTKTEELKDLFSKTDYYNALKNVVTILDDNTYCTYGYLRYLLLYKNGIINEIKDFVNCSHITPGFLIDYGTRLTRDTLICGNKQEIPSIEPLEQDTIFDLASTSKIFTSIAILKLAEDNIINLEDPITKYAPEFHYLNNITILDLLKFNTSIITNKRLEDSKNKEEAEKLLFNVHRAPIQNLLNPYTDIGSMVLRYVIEHAANMSLNEFLDSVIFKPANMVDTYLNVPEEKLNRVANENYSSIIRSDGKEIIRNNNYPGTPHDTKAVVMGHSLGIATGHAGYFSTAQDMVNLGYALIDSKIINKDSLYSISDNLVGKSSNNQYQRYYGSLVYLKQPNKSFLSVYHALSGKAFMSPGFAGTTLCIDPLNDIVLFIGANRLHNRIYQIHPNQQKHIKENKKYNTKIYQTENGDKNISSSFTIDKEKIVHIALNLTLQYKFLEKNLKQEKEMQRVLKI